MRIVTLPLDAIRLDAGTQVRAAVDPALVEEYATAMVAGAVFPPVIVFVGEGWTYLADGYHRYHAARRVGDTTIRAELHDGTPADALWYALGANRSNGQRLSEADKTHAVQLALAQWPDRVQREIAAQVGCSESLVSKVAVGLATPTSGDSGLRGRALRDHQQREAVRAALLAGQTTKRIRQTLHAHSTTIAAIKRELGMRVLETRPVTPPPTVQARVARIQEMATSGHSSAQIAAALGVSERHIRRQLRQAGHAAPADAVTRNLHHHDSNRIMARIVADADDLTAGANLIDFATLDPGQVADWIETLRAARTTISRFIARLATVHVQTPPQQKKEPSDGETTHAQAV